MVILLLCLSILLSTGRNILSKSLSDVSFGTRSFFLCQASLFLCGSIALLVLGGIPKAVALPTLGYAVIYGALLVLAQWFYTAAISHGNTGLCSTVYSMGFILPTMSGALLWSEPFSALDGVGILFAVFAIIASGITPRSVGTGRKPSYLIPLIIATLSSGGLGIVQKLQQKSEFAEQKAQFLLIAFALAAIASAIAALITRGASSAPAGTKRLLMGGGIGICFGCCNLMNTTLAGKLDSAIFFPTLNIGVILITLLCGILIFKERIGKREISVLILGLLSILFLNFG